MFLEVFFVCCFLEILAASLLVFYRTESRGDYFDKIPEKFEQELLADKIKKKYKFLDFACGEKLLFKSQASGKRVLFPLAKYNASAAENIKLLKFVDAKINNCRLVFKSVKGEIIIKKLAKYAINCLFFKNSEDVLRILQNLKIKHNISNRDFFYVKLLAIEEIAKWQNKLALDLKKFQTMVLNGKRASRIKAVKKPLSGAFVYGLIKYNKNAVKFIVKNKIDAEFASKEFLCELEFYDGKLAHLNNAINSLKNSICKPAKKS